MQKKIIFLLCCVGTIVGTGGAKAATDAECQVLSLVQTNSHINFNNMANLIVDESIWNRNHRLNKVWLDADYSRIINNLGGGQAVGNRFGATFGYDWQSSNTMIWGWTGHIARANTHEHSAAEATDLNFGGGIYFLRTLNNKFRLYADVMADADALGIRYAGVDDGDAFSFSAGAGVGIIHDWLNQYIMGNVYLRAGYNNGFDIKLDDGRVKSDDFISVIPGYSITLQKRIYTSTWFQIKPYLTAGIEYDVMNDTDIDPMWVSGTAGLEFLSVVGLHVGVGYRYTYNDAVQMHKVDASVKYRF